MQPGDDPFAQLRQEKRERIKGQEQRQLANVKLAAKGGALPPTLKLAAKLQEKGKGKQHKRKDLKNEVSRGPSSVWVLSVLKGATSLQQAAIAIGWSRAKGPRGDVLINEDLKELLFIAVAAGAVGWLGYSAWGWVCPLLVAIDLLCNGYQRGALGLPNLNLHTIRDRSGNWSVLPRFGSKLSRPWHW